MSYPDLYLLIDGERLGASGRRTIPVVNPASGETLAQLPLATPADLDRALAATKKAWPVWRGLGPQARGKILHKAADLLRERSESLARFATMEMGKTLPETRIEVGMARKSSTGTRRKAAAPMAACCRNA